MKPFAQLPISTRLLAGLALILAILVVVIGTAYLGLVEIKHSQEYLFGENFGNTHDLARLRANLNAERLAVANMLNTDRSRWGSWREDLAGRAKQDEEIVRRLLHRFRDDPDELARLHRFIARHNAFLDIRQNQMLPLLESGRIEEARNLFFGVQLEHHLAMRVIAEELEQIETENAQQRLAITERQAALYQIFFAALGGIAGLVALTVVRLMHRTFTDYVAERRKAEESLRSKNEQLTLAETFFNHSVSGLVILDRHYNFVRVNEAYARSCRMPIDAFPGRNHFELFPSDTKKLFDEVVRTKRPFETFTRAFVFSDQPERGVTYWDWTLVPVLDQQGEVEYLVFSLNEVTERKRAEDALRQSEAALREAQRIAQVGSWRWDRASDQATWSEEIYRIFQMEPGLPPPPFAEQGKLLGPVGMARLRAAVDDTLRTGGPFEVELEITRTDGSRAWCIDRGIPERDADGRIVALHGTFQDITPRREAEEAVRRSERLLRTILDNLPVGVWLIDADGRIVEGNPEAERIWGGKKPVGPEEYRNYKAWRPESGKPLADDEHVAVRALRRGETCVNEQVEIESFDGIRKTILASAVPLREDEEVTGAVVVNQDISEIRRAQEALRQREAELREAQRVAQVGSWEWDASSNVISWSEETHRIFGRSAPPASYEEHLDLYSTESAARLDALVSRALSEGMPYECDLEMRRAGGATGWVTTRGEPKRDAAGRVTGLRGTVQDVTARRRAESELRASEERFRLIAETIEDVFWISTPGIKEMLYISPTYERLWERSCESLYESPRSYLDAVHPDDRPVLMQSVALHAHGTPYEIEYRVLRRDGTVRWMHERGYPVHGERGELRAMTGVISDITERKRLEEELRQHRDHLEHLVRQRTGELERANAKLQELDRLKSMFIASMSHELRTPLNTIIGFTGIILQGMTGPINAEQRKQLTMVKESATHLLALINDLIDISKIEAGAVELSVAEFDLAALLREVAASFQVAVQTKGLALNVAAPPTLPLIGDKRRTRQILVNLLGNAVKFTDRGGIEVRLDAHDGRTEIAVRDTGIGIRRADMERLFGAFSQIVTEGRPREGSGLGLYLSRKIARLLSGDIAVESEPGKGSVFTLSLPLQQDRRAAA